MIVIFETNNKNIITGDLNSFSTLWGSTRSDKNGKLLERFLDDFEMVTVNTGEGTYIKQSGDCSQLDVTFVSQTLAEKCQWKVIYDSLGSNHMPTLTIINEEPPLNGTVQPSWIMGRADWTAYREYMDTYISELDVSTNTDELYADFVSSISKAAGLFIPRSKKKATLKTNPFWNIECQTAVRESNRARSKMNRSKLLDDCIEYRWQKGVTQRSINDASRNHWR